MPTDQNPYAPPRERERDRRRPRKRRRRERRPAPGEWVKWPYAIAAALYALVFLVLFTVAGLDKWTHQLLVGLVEGPLAWSTLVLALMWIYYAWSGIPQAFAGGISPGGAVGRLFVPIYSIYWCFGVNLQLCTSIDGVLVARGDGRRAPRALAMGATVVHLLPLAMLATEAKQYAFLLRIASSALWVVYMALCDPLRRSVWNAPSEDDR